MLVLRVAFPTSTGCLVASEVNSRTNVFLPCVHCPDSLSSVIVMSFAFCVWITFRSAPQTSATGRLVRSTTLSTVLMMTCCISCFSSLVLRHHVHRPTHVSAVPGERGLSQWHPSPPLAG